MASDLASVDLQQMEGSTIDFDCLWENAKNRRRAAEFSRILKPHTQRWILKHLIPVLSTPVKIDQDLVLWLWSNQASVIVAYGRKAIRENSLLLHAFIYCLDLAHRRPRYVFFKHSVPGSCVCNELLDHEVMSALTFLGYADILVILSEFQEDLALPAMIKELQDNATDSTHSFGMLLIGSHKTRVYEAATQIFYCVREVNFVTEGILDKWLSSCQPPDEQESKSHTK